MTTQASGQGSSLRPPWEGGPLFLKTAEAAAILRMDPRTLRRAIEAGDIVAVRLSDATWRINAEPFWRDVVGLHGPEMTNEAPANGAPLADVRALTKELGGGQYDPNDSAA